MVNFREAELSDIEAICEVEKITWGEVGAPEDMMRARIEVFKPGVIVAEIPDVGVVGVVVAFPRYFDFDDPVKTWAEATDNGYLRGVCDIKGNIIYGADLSINPQFGGMKLGKNLLWEGMQRTIVGFNKKFGILGGRIPGYKVYLDKMSEQGKEPITPEEYIKLTRDDGLLLDPELRFYRRLGYEIRGILPGYMEDPDSLNNGVLLVWPNPHFKG